MPSLPTEYECEIVHTGSNYVLYREKTIYSNPNSVTPYDYTYFAIFGHRTTVWYGGADLLLPATDTPLGSVIAFYDSLNLTDLASPLMTTILGNYYSH